MNESKLICGPFVRRFDSEQLVLWLVTDRRVNLAVQLTARQSISFSQEHQQIQLGEKCFVHLLDCKVQGQWPLESAIEYQLIDTHEQHHLPLEHLALEGSNGPTVVKRSQIQSVIQGSCRKPDHKAKDAFTAVAAHVKSSPTERPDHLIMAGDQIYADDVSSPMLIAIQLLSDELGLFSAQHQGACLDKTTLAWQNSVDKRKSLLPKKTDISAWSKFWHGDEIISSRYHDNHLVGLDEFFACYLLTWSSACWDMILPELTRIIQQDLVQQQRIQDEFSSLLGFYQQLPDFELTLANVPSLMIFDDHDVTDDWNLTADWEQHVYGHNITKHMIRDALVSYAIFQGWGNAPEQMQVLLDGIINLSETQQDFASDNLTRAVFDFNRWHYTLDTQPKIIVLDTRTHRWRSETSLKNPSGLMDWERLEQLEEQLYQAEQSVLLVSAAPIFGVKAIEVVQTVCEWVGQELLVDVENWMAHRGAARKLMSMLRHDNAPDEVIIMSGDVHYSFCFSAERRFNSNSDKIWQLTCSGFKNEFPQKLLKVFDYVDRVAYSPHSLLNLFTKRRKLEIDHHPLIEPDKPNKKGKQRHLHSESAAGLVKLNEQGYLAEFSLLTTRDMTLSFDLSID